MILARQSFVQEFLSSIRREEDYRISKIEDRDPAPVRETPSTTHGGRHGNLTALGDQKSLAFAMQPKPVTW